MLKFKFSERQILFLHNNRHLVKIFGGLAIIGLMAVGIMTIYSEITTQRLCNQVAFQMTQLAQNIHKLYAGRKNYHHLSIDSLKKAHLIPQENYQTNGKSFSMINPFGGNIWVYESGKNHEGIGDSKAFVIATNKLPYKVCVKLLTKDWSDLTSERLIAYGKSIYSALYGCSISDDYHHCAKEGIMSKNKAVKMCSKKNDNEISWKFY